MARQVPMKPKASAITAAMSAVPIAVIGAGAKGAFITCVTMAQASAPPRSAANNAVARPISPYSIRKPP